MVCRRCGVAGHAEVDCPYRINSEQTLYRERSLHCGFGHLPFLFNPYNGCPMCAAGIRVEEDAQSPQMEYDTPGGTKYMPESIYEKAMLESLARRAQGNVLIPSAKQ